MAANSAFFALGVPKKNHLHFATAAHWRFIHTSPYLSSGFRHGPYLLRFR